MEAGQRQNPANGYVSCPRGPATRGSPAPSFHRRKREGLRWSGGWTRGPHGLCRYVRGRQKSLYQPRRRRGPRYRLEDGRRRAGWGAALQPGAGALGLGTCNKDPPRQPREEGGASDAVTALLSRLLQPLPIRGSGYALHLRGPRQRGPLCPLGPPTRRRLAGSGQKMLHSPGRWGRCSVARMRFPPQPLHLLAGHPTLRQFPRPKSGVNDCTHSPLRAVVTSKWHNAKKACSAEKVPNKYHQRGLWAFSPPSPDPQGVGPCRIRGSPNDDTDALADGYTAGRPAGAGGLAGVGGDVGGDRPGLSSFPPPAQFPGICLGQSAGWPGQRQAAVSG